MIGVPTKITALTATSSWAESSAPEDDGRRVCLRAVGSCSSVRLLLLLLPSLTHIHTLPCVSVFDGRRGLKLATTATATYSRTCGYRRNCGAYNTL